MKDKIKWGILGPGKIAHKFVEDLLKSDEAQLWSVASRNRESSQTFGQKYGAQVAYGSYAELFSCPMTEVVYVATPHVFHYEQTLACLKGGKNVFCEKPLALNTRQAREMTQLAAEKGLFLMEAIWTRFLPYMQVLVDWVNNDKLGKIGLIEADFGFSADYDPDHRLFDPHLGGGALLDIGIYPVFLAQLLLGKPDEIRAKAVMGRTGVDEITSIQLYWNDGRLANLHCTSVLDTKIAAKIYGSKGWVEITPRWHETKRIILHRKEYDPEVFDFPDDYRGYFYEIEEVNRCIQKGLLQSPSLPWSFSLDLMQTLDSIREQIDLVYPLEKRE